MNSCWEVLQIRPTNDVEHIKNARRSLIKNWHPDTVAGSEEKRTYTARCAEINVAFDRAIAFANAWKPTATGPLASDHPHWRRSSFPGTQLLPGGSLWLLAIGFVFWIFTRKPIFRLLLFLLPFAVGLAIPLWFFLKRRHESSKTISG